MELFIQWMKQNGIEWRTDALEFREDGVVYGTGVKALCNLSEGDIIAKIPKKSCLTIVTTGASQHLEDAQLGGGLGLSIAIMYERSKGKKSPWYGYLQILPHQEEIPFVWTQQEIDGLLIGTELHKVIRQDKQLMKEDWEENILPLTEEYPIEFPAEHFSFECYLAAKTMVASRAFAIDDYHGQGLVPLADMFNHKTAAEDVHFMSNCSDSDTSASQDAIPFVIEDNDGATENHEVECNSDVLEMILVKDVSKGSEIFNTYGEVGNAALLHRYGFTEPGNPYDIVNMDMQLVNQVLCTEVSDADVQRGISTWKNAGFSGWESQGCQYFEIDADGEPQVELLVLLNIIKSSIQDFGTRLEKVNGNVKKVSKLLGWRPSQPCKKQKTEDSNDEDHFTELNTWLFSSESVRQVLVRLIEERDKQYRSSREEDMRQLSNANVQGDFKAIHAISLRISERAILEKCKKNCG